MGAVALALDAAGVALLAVAAAGAASPAAAVAAAAGVVEAGVALGAGVVAVASVAGDASGMLDCIGSLIACCSTCFAHHLPFFPCLLDFFGLQSLGHLVTALRFGIAILLCHNRPHYMMIRGSRLALRMGEVQFKALCV